jgi:trigger factor
MKPYEEKKGKAADGDRIIMNYLGKIEGEPFEGGADNDAQLVIGSGQFIPGFEDQLKGKKAGDETVVKVKFPDEYGAAHLAGKDAEFDVTVHKVEKPGKLVIDDEFATKLGMESVDKLKEAVRGQIEGQYSSFTRAKLKREILDTLDKKTKMELPEKMVEQEFNNIWTQMNSELERAGKTFKDEGTTEAKAKKEYQTLAERRVRLGLVLAEIGEKADVQVTDDEMQAAVYQQIQQYPGQEEQVLNYFKENPDAVAGLRAPLYEDKVIDFIVDKAEVKDKKVSKEELMKEDEDEA